MEAEERYEIRVTKEISASSPRAALRAFFYRLQNEGIEAFVTHSQSGTLYVIECQSGEVLEDE